MVIEDRTLAAVHVSRFGCQVPFKFPGLQVFSVDDLGAITDNRTGKPAGFLRFDFAEVVRVLKERARWANAVPPWEIDTAPEPEAATAAPLVTEGLVFSLLATRKQLIGAFGPITRMNNTWFDNLTHTPALLATRKYKGTGGRQSTEPLFCPYEVMLWLIKPNRKKDGKQINDTTAWRLLKRDFSKVHNLHSIGDPNGD
jgi:hypothetical protein